jgi:ribose transport system permease protein
VATTIVERDQPQDADTPHGTRRSMGRLIRALEAYALLGLTVVVAAFFSVWGPTSETYLTAANLRSLTSGNAVVAVVALAALVPLVAEEFDLSVGAIAALGAVLAAQILAAGLPVILALVVALVAGTLIGAINAVICTRVGVNAVVTTLGMSIVLAGLINQITGGTTISGNLPTWFLRFGASSTLGLPHIVWALVVIALAVYYLVDHTPYGRYLYAYGANRQAARLVGIRTRLTVGMTFVLAGLIAAAAGFLQVLRAGGADPRVGDSLLLPAITAAFLSAAAIKPGRYNVGGTIVAVLFLAVLNSGLNLAGVPPFVNSYVNGVALIAGVALAVVLGRRRA